MYNVFFSVACCARCRERKNDEQEGRHRSRESQSRSSERRKKYRLSRKHRMCARMIELAQNLLVRFRRRLRHEETNLARENHTPRARRLEQKD